MKGTKMEKRIEKIWDYLVSNGIATEEELQLITCINGYNEKSLNDVLYVRAAYHSIEQFEECEGEGEDNELE